MDEDSQFTICLHYGGKFKNNPFRYNGGKIKKHEDYNSNEMSMIEMISIIREFGYGPLDLLLFEWESFLLSRAWALRFVLKHL